MLSLPASKPQSPHKGSLGISLREDRTETRLMLSLPAAKPHSPHKRSLGIILKEEKARLMLSLPVCRKASWPHFWGEDHTETRLMPSLGAQQMVSGFRLGEDHAKACVMLSLPVCKPRSPPERALVSFLDEDQTETRLMLSLAGLLAEPTNNLHGGPACSPRRV